MRALLEKSDGHELCVIQGGLERVTLTGGEELCVVGPAPRAVLVDDLWPWLVDELTVSSDTLENLIFG